MARRILDFQNDTLGYLIKRGQHLLSMNILIQKALPDNLATHCKIANYRDRVLVLEADSSTWASLLRYQLPKLLSALRKHFPEMQDIKLYTSQQAVQQPSLTKLHLSIQAANKLREVARSIHDGPLQQILFRLAEHEK